MRASATLFSALKFTLYTRPSCPPCHSAKVVLSRIWEASRFDYEEVDVSTPGRETEMAEWGNDTPVLKVERVDGSGEKQLLMHRIKAEDVRAAMAKLSPDTQSSS